MPKPIAICIEDLDVATGEGKYLRCVAVPGRQPGLRVDGQGTVLWQSDEAVACELWVSADDCLILYRPAGAEGVVVSRAGRNLEVPYGKPVVLIDQDEVRVGRRHLRVHVHGEAPAVMAPSAFVPVQNSPGRLARAAAAAAVISSAVLAAGCNKDIQVRDAPPVVPPPKIDVREQPPEVMAPTPPTPPPPPPTTNKIEVREQPPDMMDKE